MYYFLNFCSLAVILLGISGFKAAEDRWFEYFRNDQVTIETMDGLCDNQQSGISKNYIFLRVSNQTNKKIKVSFTREMWYGDDCIGCNGGSETTSELVLEANQSIEGSCGSATKDLKIFKEMANGSEGTKKKLSKFDLKNVTITKVR